MEKLTEPANETNKTVHSKDLGKQIELSNVYLTRLFLSVRMLQCCKFVEFL